MAKQETRNKTDWKKVDDGHHVAYGGRIHLTKRPDHKWNGNGGMVWVINDELLQNGLVRTVRLPISNRPHIQIINDYNNLGFNRFLVIQHKIDDAKHKFDELLDSIDYPDNQPPGYHYTAQRKEWRSTLPPQQQWWKPRANSKDAIVVEVMLIGIAKALGHV